MCKVFQRTSNMYRPGIRCGLTVAALLTSSLASWASTLSDPAVDSYNVHVGTQTFSAKYQFTTNTLLVETAEAIHELGSDVIKFFLGQEGFSTQNGFALPPNITNLVTEVRDEPSCRRVFDMPFRHFILWVYPFGWTQAKPFDGYSESERSKEYREIYDLTCYFLTNYNNSGKSFYLGHWEGDWYLLQNYDTTTNPNPVRIQGMRDWLNNRQQAVDDATRDTVHTNVNVFNYAEVNRVRDAMSSNTNINQRMINEVVPYVTNLDCVSWSSYDGQNLGAADLINTLDYMQSQLPTNKASHVPGQRIWIGEYSWGASRTTAEQEPLNRSYLQRLLPWGPRFILYWEMYNNGVKTNGSFMNHCLINPENVKVESWYLYHRFINQARLLTARFQETYGRLPTDAEFAGLAGPLLDQELPAPTRMILANQDLVGVDTVSATVTVQTAQGIYGDECANVGVCWGRQDGGTARDAWEHFYSVGINTNFNPTDFIARLSNLSPGNDYFFRFYATNANGEAWSPATAQLATPEQPANGSFESQPAGTTKSIGSGGAVDTTTFNGWRVFSAGSPAVSNFTATIITNASDGSLAMCLSLMNTGGAPPKLDHGLDNWKNPIPVAFGVHYNISFDAAWISGSTELSFSVTEFDAANKPSSKVTVVGFSVSDTNYQTYALSQWTPLTNTTVKAVIGFRQRTSGVTTDSVMSFDNIRFSAAETAKATDINIAGTTARMDFMGNPGYAYVVQQSTNLLEWINISTNIVPGNGSFAITNDIGGQPPVPNAAFYRLWQPW